MKRRFSLAPSVYFCAVLLLVVRASLRAQVDPFSESGLFSLNTASIRPPDEDGDGMPDDYEDSVGLTPFADDANEDPDGDGISNIQEYYSGTDPFVRNLEAFHAFSDLFTLDTTSFFADSDADGLPDAWELRYFGNRLSATPQGDPDSDGHSNYEEFVSGTNPNDNWSVFRVEKVTVSRIVNASVITIQWPSVEGVTYSVWSTFLNEVSDSLIETNIAATPPINSYTAVLHQTNVFIRVQAAH